MTEVFTIGAHTIGVLYHQNGAIRCSDEAVEVLNRHIDSLRRVVWRYLQNIRRLK